MAPPYRGAGNRLLPGVRHPSNPDLVQLIESHWFGWPEAGQPEEQGAERGAERKSSGRQLFSEGSSGSLDGRGTAGRCSTDSTVANAEAGQHGPDRAATAEARNERRQQQQQRQQQRGGSAAKLAVPARTEQDEQAGLGTWASRQRIFPERLQAQRQASDLQGHPIQESPDSANGHAQQDAVNEDDELHAAWRWRFRRKWQMEQAKQFEPGFGKPGGDEEDDDEWGAALGYLDAGGAVGGGLNLQIARTVSLGAGASLSSPSLSQSLATLLLEGSVRGENSLRDADEASSMDATKQLVAVARRAAQLQQQQREIERDVERRWESAAKASDWVGGHLPAVAVDAWGRFTFTLVQLADRGGKRTKLLLRGTNGTTEAATLRALEREVAHASVTHRMPGPRVEHVGSGIMEWARDRDRVLNITGGRLHRPAAGSGNAGDPQLRSAEDVLQVARVLARSSLPAGYLVAVNGERQN